MTITALRKPTTCVWCGIALDGLEQLLDHVDEHLDEPTSLPTAA